MSIDSFRFLRLLTRTAALWVGFATVTAYAVELPGEIDAVNGSTIAIKVDSQWLPRKGDSVVVNTQHPTLGTVPIGTWQVIQVTKSTVFAARQSAIAEPTTGMRVVIDSPNPLDRNAFVTPKPTPKPSADSASRHTSTAAPQGCALYATYTTTLECPPGSVYAGPIDAQQHGGVCLSADECRMHSWKAGFKQCGPYAVYAGPEDVARHAGTCVLLDEPGYRLQATQTSDKQCGDGVYAGPNRPELHAGTCLHVIKLRTP